MDKKRLQIIDGGRDQIERRLVDKLFYPGNTEDIDLSEEKALLKPWGKDKLTLIKSDQVQNAQSVPHRSDAEQDEDRPGHPG